MIINKLKSNMGLTIGALIVFGLVQGAVLIALALILTRFAPAGPDLIHRKLGIAWAAVVLTIIALFGVISLYSEVLSNG